MTVPGFREPDSDAVPSSKRAICLRVARISRTRSDARLRQCRWGPSLRLIDVKSALMSVHHVAHRRACGRFKERPRAWGLVENVAGRFGRTPLLPGTPSKATSRSIPAFVSRKRSDQQPEGFHPRTIADAHGAVDGERSRARCLEEKGRGFTRRR